MTVSQCIFLCLRHKFMIHVPQLNSHSLHFCACSSLFHLKYKIERLLIYRDMFFCTLQNKSLTHSHYIFTLLVWRNTGVCNRRTSVFTALWQTYCTYLLPCVFTENYLPLFILKLHLTHGLEMKSAKSK